MTSRGIGLPDMLLVLQAGIGDLEADRVVESLSRLGIAARLVRVGARAFVRLERVPSEAAEAIAATVPEAAALLPFERPVLLAAGSADRRSPIRVGEVEIGGSRLAVIAGPCAVEGEEQVASLAAGLRRAGADLLRGGAFKPRSSPHDFQGLGETGLRMLARAGREAGLPIVTEALDEASLALAEEWADVVQIGARNMHNTALLRRAGRGRRPVLLKRGFAARLEELLLAAEYVLEQGNPHVMLCERGIRTFDDHSRFTLDLAAVPRLKGLTHLPVLVDPSHASGRADLVEPLARAAVAAGADGVMIEVHPAPDRALCDGPQSLPFERFKALVAELRAVEQLLAASREPVT